mgnify:CR=1 FL=1
MAAIYKRDELLKDLKQHVAEVTFTKVNGEKRVMRCTLSVTLIPGDKMPKGDSTSTRKRSDLVQPVFDLEKSEWRSFAWESVTEVTS